MFQAHEDFYVPYKMGVNISQYFDGKRITNNKRITYYNDIVAFDIETSSFTEFDEDSILTQDIEIYNYLKGTKIKINDKVYKEFPDFNLIRRDLFGRLYFSKNDGISIDSLYSDLCVTFPYAFNDEVINPYDQLARIIDAFQENEPIKEETNNKRSVMYVWQVAINGYTIIGRTWAEFIELINYISSKLNLSQDNRLIIWVHNLSMEFQYIKDYFEWKKVFALTTRKPIYALTTGGVEFRCSYILSNLSLANVGKSLKKYKVLKKEGDLNYDLVRHNETPLDPVKEIPYIINDVLVVSCYIKELMEQCGNNITRLPLTSTGFCRNHVKEKCLGHKNSLQFERYHKMISYLTIKDLDEYEQMQRAFAGGFTHCSARHSGDIMYDVDSFDLCSAYPGALCLFNEFPMSKGTVVTPQTTEELKKYLRLYCCIFDVKFINIRPRVINENYISISKCFEIKNPVNNNGRLVGADIAALTITNIDFDIIRRFYVWDDMKIGTFRIYKKGYLPKEIILSILDLFKNKTELKGVPGQEDFYTKNKQLLNSIYGMMVTSILMPFHDYDNIEGWTIDHRDPEKELNIYNKSKKRFLYFPWGIFCTALVRRTVASAILAFGDSYIYSDTDSIKAVNAKEHESYILKYNEFIKKQIMKVCSHYKINPDMFMPKTIKGETKILGIWEKETPKPWKKFKSLGAKRYMILTSEDELTLTVSGVNKKAAIPYMLETYGKDKAFDAFDNKLIIPAGYTGKLTHYYLDEPHAGYITDYLGNTIRYESKSGIYFEKTSYNFSMDAAYLKYLDELKGKIIA